MLGTFVDRLKGSVVTSLADGVASRDDDLEAGLLVVVLDVLQIALAFARRAEERDDDLSRLQTGRLSLTLSRHNGSAHPCLQAYTFSQPIEQLHREQRLSMWSCSG